MAGRCSPPTEYDNVNLNDGVQHDGPSSLPSTDTDGEYLDVAESSTVTHRVVSPLYAYPRGAPAVSANAAQDTTLRAPTSAPTAPATNGGHCRKQGRKLGDRGRARHDAGARSPLGQDATSAGEEFAVNNKYEWKEEEPSPHGGSGGGAGEEFAVNNKYEWKEEEPSLCGGGGNGNPAGQGSLAATAEGPTGRGSVTSMSLQQLRDMAKANAACQDASSQETQVAPWKLGLGGWTGYYDKGTPLVRGR